jgi:hypothetical protein
MPVANAGALRPTMEKKTTLRSTPRWRRTAATTPSGMPRRIVRMKASPASSAVNASRCAIPSRTGSLVLIDVPKSSVAASPAQWRYRTRNGSFRWYCSRTARIVCGSTVFAFPSNSCSGLPGAR